MSKIQYFISNSIPNLCISRLCSEEKKEEDCVLTMMMSDAGREMGMEFLDSVMRKRKEYLLY